MGTPPPPNTKGKGAGKAQHALNVANSAQEAVSVTLCVPPDVQQAWDGTLASGFDRPSLRVGDPATRTG